MSVSVDKLLQQHRDEYGTTSHTLNQNMTQPQNSSGANSSDNSGTTIGNFTTDNNPISNWMANQATRGGLNSFMGRFANMVMGKGIGLVKVGGVDVVEKTVRVLLGLPPDG